MILGRMQARTQVAEVKARLTADPRPDVRDGVIGPVS